MLKTLYEQIQEYGKCVYICSSSEQYIIEDVRVTVEIKCNRVVSILYTPLL